MIKWGPNSTVCDYSLILCSSFCLPKNLTLSLFLKKLLAKMLVTLLLPNNTRMSMKTDIDDSITSFHCKDPPTKSIFL